MLILKREDNCEEVPVKWSKFPGGETHVSLGTIFPGYNGQFLIEMKFQSNDDLINLALLVDALRRKYIKPVIRLVSMYFPYARQDRVCNKGESHSLAVIANFINSLDFESVTILDPHSDVAPALINRVLVTSPAEIVVEKILYKYKDYEIVCPDGGALKRTRAVAKVMGKRVIRADKLRDLQTGAISGVQLIDKDFAGKNVLVVDDICDGGGTFIPLGEELRKVTDKEVALYVTHGIFSKGLNVLLSIYDVIYVANNLSGITHEKLKVVL